MEDLAMSRQHAIALLAFFAAMAPAHAQTPPALPPGDRPPVIDVHLHSGPAAGFGQRIDELDRHNVVLRLVSGALADAQAWAAADPKRFWAGVLFPCPGGRMPTGGPQCFPDGAEFPSLDYLRDEFGAGRLRLLGEITAQYAGLSPADPALEPYFALAEELDVPVAIHLALAPPETPYKCCPRFRAALGNPVLLEEVLIRHPKLRVFVMHAGQPYLAEMQALMLVYPQVYVDIGAISLTSVLPRTAFYDHLQGL
ncbi:MAG: amidohydrolase family protein, partial [Geminicoccales bacterium]